MVLKKVTPSTDDIQPFINSAQETFLEDAHCQSYFSDLLAMDATTFYFYYNDFSQPVGLCIIEELQSGYGNIILHTLNESVDATFCTVIYSDGLLHGNVFELIQFRETFVFRDTFLSLGCKEKERMRMIHTELDMFKDSNNSSLQFQTISKDNVEICAHISHHAHKYRTHVEHYDMYTSIKKRTEFSLMLQDNPDNPYISEASILAFEDNHPVGMIETCESKSFDGERYGWIMDIAVHPNYQGIGYGAMLIQQSLSNLYDAGYKQAGLAVTLSNKRAKKLYDSLGFTDHHYFVEIIG